MAELATFKAMSEGTQQDWDTIMAEQPGYMAGLAGRILAHMRLLDDNFGGYPVDRLQHSLQTAELAAEDGRDDEYVVCALLHDIGDTVGSANHADVSAAILRPFISDENHWMVKHHGIFQGYNFFHFIGKDRNLRDQFRSSPHYEYTEEFIARYDNPAFDHDKPRLSLEMFEPLVARVFEKPKNNQYEAAVK